MDDSICLDCMVLFSFPDRESFIFAAMMSVSSETLSWSQFGIFTDPISAPLRSTLTVASMLLRLMIFPRLTKAFNSGTSSRKARATMRVSNG